MDLINYNLEQAIHAVNNHSRYRLAENYRNQLIQTLEDNLIQLDGMNHIDRKETIIAIQNIIYQLEHIYDKDKPIILLSSKIILRTTYLPENKASTYALGNAFSNT